MNAAVGALTVLTRLAVRRPDGRITLELALRGRLEALAYIALDVAIEAGGPIGSVLAELIQTEGSIDLVESMLIRFDESRYRDSVSLYEAGLALTQRALSHRQELSITRPKKRVAEIARFTNNLCFSLSVLGRQEQALKAAQSAVAMQRSLSSGDPEQDYELAVSLSNLGVVESNLGNYESALRETEEAVQISRSLAEKWPLETAPVLAQSLLNLGSIYFSFGSGENALAATREAVKILQRLADDDPEAFSASLARSLNNLGAILRSLGRLGEAFEASSRGLTLRRSLALVRPDVFLGDLAISLQSVASTLSEQASNSDEALAAIREAVEIRRRLIAKGGSTSSILDLVESLETLAAVLLEGGDRETSRRVLVESIEFLLQAEAQRPAKAAERLRVLLERLTLAMEEPGSIADPTMRITLLEQVVRSVALFFHKQPLIFADPMNTAVLTYLATLLRVGREADRELLRPIIQDVEKEIIRDSPPPL